MDAFPGTTVNGEPRPVSQLLEDLSSDLASGHARELIPLETGFQPLDNVIGGGLRPGDLILVGGMPGAGKTVLALQWARNLARAGVDVTYLCYEHEEADLLMRLLALEMGELPEADQEDTEKIRLRIRDAAVVGGRGLREVFDQDPLARTAYERLQVYARWLRVLKASGRYTGVPEIERMLTSARQDRSVLVVDYLQKVALARQVPDEAEKVTIVTEDLKELALTYKVPMVCVVAADRQGLKSPRLRLHDLRGSSALAFESDIAIMLNDKYSAVAKVHRAYDPLKAATFRDWVVASIEKNRGGPPGVHLEFRKDFAHFRFDPVGGVVSETLVDERSDAE